MIKAYLIVVLDGYTNGIEKHQGYHQPVKRLSFHNMTDTNPKKQKTKLLFASV